MAGISALLKSAQATRTAIDNYNDSVAAYDFQNSAYTDDAYQAYSTYLNKRMDSLSGDNTISGATKKLAVTKALDSATKSNISATIQRENIQVLAGNATLTDKYNTVAAQYTRAVNNGDLTLAQSLESQAYSISQQIQYAAQQSADAASALATKSTNNSVAAINQRVQDIQSSFKDLNTQLSTQGYKNFNGTVAAWVKSQSETLKEMGVVLPADAQPNYFDLMHGIQGYMYNAYETASQALAASNPDSAQDYHNKALAIANGSTKLEGLAGSMSSRDVVEASSNPKEFKFDPSSGKFQKTNISGVAPSFHANSDGSIVTGTQDVYSGSIVKVVDPELNTQLKALKLNFDTSSKDITESGSQGVRVEASTATDPAIRKIVQAGGGTTSVFWNPDLNNPNNTTLPNAKKGGLQFESSATGGANGDGKAVYSVVYDKNGKKQIYESGGYADKLYYSDPGYDDGTTPQDRKPGKGFFGTIGDNLMSGVKNTASLFGGVKGPSGAHPATGTSGGYTGELLKAAQGTRDELAAKATQLQAAQMQPLQGLPMGLPPIPQYQAPAANTNQAPATAHINIAPNVMPTANISIKPAPVQGKFLGVSNKPNTSKISF